MILSGKSKHEIMNIISKNTFSGNMVNEVRNMEKEKCLKFFTNIVSRVYSLIKIKMVA